jgi:hypothetical protein
MWNKVYSNYSNQPFENPNGWESEYYEEEHQEASQSDWLFPRTPEEDDIERVWAIETVAYNFSNKELDSLFDELIKTKWIIAGQLVQQGRWSCKDHCDIENHHIHSYCTVCRKQVPYGMERDHGCKFGFEKGMIHPEMNPKYLFNEVFWSEPELPKSDESDDNSEGEFGNQAARDIRRIETIMRRHSAGTTRVSTYQTNNNRQRSFKPIGRRFPH